VATAPNRLIAPLAVLVAAVAVTVVAQAAGSPNGRASHPPKLVQLSYSESDDGSSPSRALDAFVRYSTDSVNFATRYHGERATAKSVYEPHITDTDIHGQKAKHPWKLSRKGGGRNVLRLIHKSLKRRGIANVRTRMRHGGFSDHVRVRIVLSDCAQDPPLYPIDCEVKP
jgi:hypothetical protein